MPANAHVDAVRSAVQALNGGDIDAYLGAFEPSCLRWVPGVPDGLPLADIAESLTSLREALSDFQLEEIVLFGGDDHVCARWRTVGRHTGEYFGVPATGRSVSIENCEVYQFDGDRVVASWVYGDPLDLFRQLGALPETGAAQ